MELDSLSLIPTAIQWISLRFHETSHVEQPYQPYVLERNLIPIQKLPRKRGTTGHQTSPAGKQPSAYNLSKFNKA